MQLSLTYQVTGRGYKRKANAIFTVFEPSAKSSDSPHKRMKLLELDVLAEEWLRSSKGLVWCSSALRPISYFRTFMSYIFDLVLLSASRSLPRTALSHVPHQHGCTNHAWCRPVVSSLLAPAGARA
jgi:hypothetical protein